MLEQIKALGQWMPPEVPEDIEHGDMPGDKVQIGEGHIQKANTIFPELLKLLPKVVEKNGKEKVVLCVCGGSGVGKSEIASLLSFYFRKIGISSYTMSGDNYPRRIPKYNDAERLHIFRESALQGMIKGDDYTLERFKMIQEWQKAGIDADRNLISEYPWMASYIESGKEGLSQYLGTSNEIEFSAVEDILKQFHQGQEHIWLKRMGRSEEELWYANIDFSKIEILIVEWTHGNSDNFQGVDLPILLNSTPQETLEHRRARNRDGATDSPFTTMVLELEQKKLASQAHKAAIILSKSCEILSYDEYKEIMDKER